MDQRGTYEDGWEAAMSGVKRSEIRDDRGALIGFRRGPWSDGYRAACIKMDEEKRKSRGYSPTSKFSTRSTGWDKK